MLIISVRSGRLECLLTLSQTDTIGGENGNEQTISTEGNTWRFWQGEVAFVWGGGDFVFVFVLFMLFSSSSGCGLAVLIVLIEAFMGLLQYFQQPN